jgi:cytochrome c-type biogenesis protein CcmF
LLWLVGVRHFMTLFTLMLAVLAVALIAGEFVRPVQARRAARGEGIGQALGSVLGKNRRRYGGYIVHLGIVILAVGIALSSTYRHETEVTLRPGETTTFQGYTLQLDSIYAGREPHRDFVEAKLLVGKGERLSSVMRPRMNYYPMSQQPIGTPSVRTRPKEDFYLSLMAYAQNGSSATVNVIVNPAVVWIWIGGGIAVLGALFAISSIGIAAERAREQTSVAEVTGEPAEAGVGGSD